MNPVPLGIFVSLLRVENRGKRQTLDSRYTCVSAINYSLYVLLARRFYVISSLFILVTKTLVALFVLPPWHRMDSPAFILWSPRHWCQFLRHLP